jgi:hypothetical protein
MSGERSVHRTLCGRLGPSKNSMSLEFIGVEPYPESSDGAENMLSRHSTGQLNFARPGKHSYHYDAARHETA